jgi:hypothetical protein
MCDAVIVEAIRTPIGHPGRSPVTRSAASAQASRTRS